MPGASIALDQARPSGTSFGTPGIARNDLWVGRTISPRSAIGGNASQVWTLIGAPAGSTAFLTNPDDVTCSFTPDLPGTYLIQLVTNGGGTGNNNTLVARCRYDVNGALTSRGWALPAVGELLPFANYNGNERGWDEPWDFIIADLLANASFSGGGGVTAVQDNGRTVRARDAGLMRAIGVTTTLSAPATEATGLGRVNSWVSGPSTDTALVVGLASGAYYFLDALTMQPDTNSGSVPGGGPVHIYCSGGKAVMVGATKAVIVEPNGSAGAVTITSPSNFGGYAVSVPGTGNQEILLITSPADATVYYYNLTTGGAVGYAYTAAPGTNPTGICVDNEGNVWIEFVADGTATNAFLVKFTCSTTGVLTPAGVSVAHFLTTTNLVFDGRYIWGVASNGTYAVLQQVRVADASFALDVLSTNCSTRASVLWDGELLVVSTTNALIKVHPETFEQKVTQTVASADLGALTLSPDGKALFYSSMVTGTPALAKYANPRAEELDRLGLTSAGASKVLVTNPYGELVGLSGGSNGQLVTMVGGVPAWAPAPVSFTAGGDLSGTNTSQTVAGFYNTPLDTSMSGPADGDFIQKVSGTWHAITAAVAAVAILGASVGNTPSTGQLLTATGTNTATWQPAPSGFTAGGDLSGTATSQTVDSISGTSPILINNASVLEWAQAVSSPTFTQQTPTSNLTPQNLEIHGQYPWSGSSGAGELPGSVTITLYDPKFQLAGGLLIQYASTPLIRMGEYVGNQNDSGVIWFKDAGSPSSTNWGIRGTSSALEFNAPSGGNMLFEVGGTGSFQIEINSSGVAFPQLAGSGAGYATLDNSGVIGWAATGVAHGTAGQIFVTNAAPAAVFTSLITYNTTTGLFTSGGSGSNCLAVVGPFLGDETQYAAVYLLNNGSTPGSNWTVRSDGTSVTEIQSPTTSSGISFWMAGSVYSAFIASGVQGYLSLGNVVASYANSALVSDGSTFTNVNVNGTGAIGFTQANTTYILTVGIDGGVRTVDAGAFPINYINSGGNYLQFWAKGASSTVYFNADTIWFLDHTASTSYLSVVPGVTTTIETTQAATALTLIMHAQTTDVAPGTLTIQGQSAWTGASTNVTGGDVVVNAGLGKDDTSTSTQGNIRLNVGNALYPSSPTQHGQVYIGLNTGAQLFAFGTYVGNGAYSVMWGQGANAPTNANWVFLDDGTNTYFNALSAGGVLYFGNGGNYHMAISATQMFVGADSIAGPLYFDWSTSTTPAIVAGTSSTSLRIGTNNGGATTSLMYDAFLTAVTISETGGTTANWAFYSPNGTQQFIMTVPNNGNVTINGASEAYFDIFNAWCAISLASEMITYCNTVYFQNYLATVTYLELNTNGLTLGFAVGNNDFIGSTQWTLRSSSSSFTIDTTTTDATIWATATQSITAPAPTLGRRIKIVVDFAAAGVLTFLQYASEAINQVASSYVINVAAGASYVLDMISDGTNWVIG